MPQYPKIKAIDKRDHVSFSILRSQNPSDAVESSGRRQYDIVWNWDFSNKIPRRRRNSALRSFPRRIMLLGKNSADKTHYEILSARESSTYEEIRACYRAAILNSHPDKSHQNNGSPDDAFFTVQKAWEVLGNPTSRALYDNDLRASRRDDVTVADDVSVGDMMVEDGGDMVELYHQCRCGDYFSVDSSELGKMGYRLLRDNDMMSLQTGDASPASVVLPCGSCSLRIRVLIDSDVCLSVCDVF